MRLALHESGLIDRATMRAEPTVRPNPCFQPLAGFCLVLEDRIGKIAHGSNPWIASII